MDEKYIRNKIYLSSNDQALIKSYPILIAGCGIGSNIAECALRLGFENLTLVDGDKVERSNLNRQNYTVENISDYKSESLYKRLKAINPEASVKYSTEYIDYKNIDSIIGNHKVAINALDFTSDIPLHFDRLCKNKNISVIHPYNLGWAGLAVLISPDSVPIDSLSGKNFNEIELVKYIISDLKSENRNYTWLEDILNRYLNEAQIISPPQLSIASSITAGLCSHILYLLATGRPAKEFPQYYINSAFL
ncbi:ThiF family adenylyltransferase [uncultured Chryseobacterium sp.]|uniref:ThiF family adenylyltransferase n=1 Tax=uncultured Chryseobacterium sp. TaxID=259322 RepID=UPI0025F7932F|nr:ThiF family adenylyltransferase [uncultured Chryseobacterium sp.]